MQFLENQTDLLSADVGAAARPKASEIKVLETGATLRIAPFSTLRVRDADGWEKMVTGADPIEVSGPLVYTDPENCSDAEIVSIGTRLRRATAPEQAYGWLLKVVVIWLLGSAALAVGGAATHGNIVQMFFGVFLCIGLIDAGDLLLKPSLEDARRVIVREARLRTIQIDPANLRA